MRAPESPGKMRMRSRRVDEVLPPLVTCAEPSSSVLAVLEGVDAEW